MSNSNWPSCMNNDQWILYENFSVSGQTEILEWLNWLWGNLKTASCVNSRLITHARMQRSGVSLRIAVAGESCKVTGEYFERVKNFLGNSLKTSLEILRFKPCWVWYQILFLVAAEQKTLHTCTSTRFRSHC